MIAQELEVSLHMAFMEARQKRHEFITVEHLLLALVDNPSASDVLKACVLGCRSAPKSWESSSRRRPSKDFPGLLPISKKPLAAAEPGRP